jgi:hypothetical protein
MWPELEHLLSDRVRQRPMRAGLVRQIYDAVATADNNVLQFAEEQTEFTRDEHCDPNTAMFLDDAKSRQLLAAIYSINSRYLNRAVRGDEQLHLHMVPGAGRATYEQVPKLRGSPSHIHAIRVPERGFTNLGMLSYCLDAETRHAVHVDLLADEGVQTGVLAKRAYLVVGETIDEGNCHWPGANIVDPFINDFSMGTETTGHDGAGYLCMQLKTAPTALRHQLRWLARLPVRPSSEKPDSYVWAEATGRSVRDIIQLPESERNFQVVASLHDSTLRRLTAFYLGCEPDFDPAWHLVAEPRRHLLKECPYQPPQGQSLRLGGKEITNFASMLDYVVLNLRHTPPRELHAQTN